MAKKKSGNENPYAYLLSIAFAIAAGLVLAIFTLAHYQRMKKKYVDEQNASRVFDIAGSWQSFIACASALFFVGFLFTAALGSVHPILWTTALTLPTLLLFNWLGKRLAFVLLGFVVDNNAGIVRFPPNAANLDLTDYLLFWRALKKMTTLDSVSIDDLQRITRYAGKSLYLHGDFGSREVSFSSKLKRDEAIFLLTNNANESILASELESS